MSQKRQRRGQQGENNNYGLSSTHRQLDYHNQSHGMSSLLKTVDDWNSFSGHLFASGKPSR